MARSIGLFLLFVISIGSAVAQLSDSAFHVNRATRHVELGLHTGYVQGRYGFADLGLSANVWGADRHPYGAGAFLGTEVRVDRTALIGPKVGFYFTGGSAMGAQFIYYTDGGEGSWVFRPEIGIGLFKFKLTYGYNVRLSNADMPGLNTHIVNVSYAFRLLRLKGDEFR
ncbi:MAG: hypothetical protein IT226_08280 [Flavobacteriales bacterium]|nr:hypothetical protein [Flavobacteriales bacterium]